MLRRHCRKNTAPVLATVAFCAITVASALAAAPLQEQAGDAELARVNGTPVTIRDLRHYAAVAGRRAGGEGEILENLINHRLLYDAARQRFLPSPAVESAIEKSIDQNLERMKKNAGGTIEFVNRLHEKDISLQEWKSQVREMILVSHYVREETRKQVRVRPAALRRYYRRNR